MASLVPDDIFESETDDKGDFEVNSDVITGSSNASDNDFESYSDDTTGSKNVWLVYVFIFVVVALFVFLSLAFTFLVPRSGDTSENEISTTFRDRVHEIDSDVYEIGPASSSPENEASFSVPEGETLLPTEIPEGATEEIRLMGAEVLLNDGDIKFSMLPKHLVLVPGQTFGASYTIEFGKNFNSDFTELRVPMLSELIADSLGVDASVFNFGEVLSSKYTKATVTHDDYTYVIRNLQPDDKVEISVYGTCPSDFGDTTGSSYLPTLTGVSGAPHDLVEFSFQTAVASSFATFPNTYTSDGDFSNRLKEMINTCLTEAVEEGKDPQERFNLFGEKLSEAEIPSAMTVDDNGILQFVVPSTGQCIEADLTMQNGMPVLYPDVEY